MSNEKYSIEGTIENPEVINVKLPADLLAAVYSNEVKTEYWNSIKFISAWGVYFEFIKASLFPETKRLLLHFRIIDIEDEVVKKYEEKEIKDCKSLTAIKQLKLNKEVEPINTSNDYLKLTRLVNQLNSSIEKRNYKRTLKFLFEIDDMFYKIKRRLGVVGKYERKYLKYLEEKENENFGKSRNVSTEGLGERSSEKMD